jgi:acyl carrier protein
MQIVTAFEQEFSINFDFDDLNPENFQSIDSLNEMVSRYLNNN